MSSDATTPEDAPEVAELTEDAPPDGPIKGVIAAAVNNPVTVHLLTVFLLVAGLFSYFTMPREIFPDFTRERIRILTIYLGASPQDIEELITVKVEDAVDGVDGVESVESTSQEGISTVIVRLIPGADVNRVLQDLDREVQAINDLPADLQNDPRVEEVKTRFPVIALSIYGDVDELALKDVVRPIKKQMEAIPGVQSARPTGIRELEWRIEVKPEALLRFELTIEDVARALGARNQNLPAGALEGERGDLLLRTKAETKSVTAIEAVVVRASPDGAHVRVRDVARVIPGFERALTYGRFNGKKALNLTALKSKDGDIIAISEAVKELAAKLELPAGVEAAVHTDMSVFLRSRLETMQKNAFQGFFLVMLSLCLLLNWRMAILVAFGIPLAFLATFAMMSIGGVSINMMSLFAMILILGMLVDDAIIVTENIYRRMEEGESPREAAINGTAEVARPVIATILTTVSAFLPMLLTPGEMGQWMGVVPVVVTLCLLASLVECFGILPCHVAEFAAPQAETYGWFERVRGRYEGVVRAAFKHRYPLIAATVGGSLVLVVWASTQVKFTLFGKFVSDTYFLNFELPSTASLDESSTRAKEIEGVVLALPDKERASVTTNIGISALDFNRADTGSYLGQVIITFSVTEQRERDIPTMLDELRQGCDALQGFTKLEFKGLQAGPGGPAIEVAVEGDDPKKLRLAAEEIKGWLRTQSGVQDVFDDASPGKAELEVVVDQEAAAALGLDTRAVARQVRHRFQGLEATTVRRIDEDVPLMVRYPKSARILRQSLEDVWLTTPSNQRVPLRAVARVRQGQGLTRISRSQRRRAITVLADVDLRRANAIEITGKLERRFKETLPRDHQVDLVIKGQQREAEQSMVGLMKAFMLALLLIYLILGTQFKSFLQPLFVMIAIPFGIDGILLGHVVMGKDLTFLSMMGLVATSGIVVNDSLVLVDLINRLRDAGVPVYEAAIRGSTQRLRPILLTSITTVLGLTPLAFFASGQATFLAPMAISIVFGITFGTVLTLIVIPALYLILEDLKAFAREIVYGAEAIVEPEQPPASPEGTAPEGTPPEVEREPERPPEPESTGDAPADPSD